MSKLLTAMILAIGISGLAACSKEPTPQQKEAAEFTKKCNQNPQDPECKEWKSKYSPG